MNINRKDFDAFMDRVADDPLDELLENTYGNEAKREVELENLTAAEVEFLMEALVTALAEAEEDGDVLRYSIRWRLLTWVLDQDEAVSEEYDKMIESLSEPNVEIIGGMLSGEL